MATNAPIDRGIGRIPVGRDFRTVEHVRLEARVDAADGNAALAQQLVLETIVGNAQVRVANVLFRETGVAVQLRDDVVVAVRRKLRALRRAPSRYSVSAKFSTCGKQRVQRRRIRKRVMVPRRRRFGRQIENVRPVAAADRRAVVVVDVRSSETTRAARCR